MKRFQNESLSQHRWFYLSFPPYVNSLSMMASGSGNPWRERLIHSRCRPTYHPTWFLLRTVARQPMESVCLKSWGSHFSNARVHRFGESPSDLGEESNNLPVGAWACSINDSRIFYQFIVESIVAFIQELTVIWQLNDLITIVAQIFLFR